MNKIVVECVDGRRFPLDGMSAEDAVAYLRSQGVTPALVKQTVHYLDVRAGDAPLLPVRL
jgi:hypothetical protein